MVIVISGAYYIWKLGRDPLIFLKCLVVIGHVCIYWSKVAEGFSVFNAVLVFFINMSNRWYTDKDIYANGASAP